MTKIVNEESFTIGRSIDCAISLSEDSISRVHLIVSHKGNQVWIEDKGSSNGTFVNDTRITNNTPIHVVSTDKVRIGKSEYVLNMEVDAPSEEVLQAPKPAASGKTIDVAIPAIQQVVSKIAEKAIPVKEEKRSGDVFVHKLEANPVPQRPAAKVETPYVDNSAMFEGERILHEAHKKAAAIIYESESKAEKRVQAIYIQAREKQAEADSYYQKKISQAHKEADAILVNFQTQGQDLILQARKFAEEMRDEVDLYSQNLREKAKQEVEDILTEAREEAEILKADAYEKAISKAETDSKDMIANAKSESQDILSFAKLQSDEMLTTARMEIQDQIKDLQFQAEEKQKELAYVKKELEEYSSKAVKEKDEYESVSQELNAKLSILRNNVEAAEEALAKARTEAEQTLSRVFEETDKTISAAKEEAETTLSSAKAEAEAALTSAKNEAERTLTSAKIEADSLLSSAKAEAERTVSSAKIEEAQLYKEVADHRAELLELKKQIDLSTSGKKTLETRNKELQEQLGRFQLDIQSAEERKRQIDHEYEVQKTQIRNRLDKEKTEMMKDAEERMQDAQLEIGKRMEKLEREMFDEIMSRKENIVKEVVIVVETRIAKVLEPAKWDEVSGLVLEGVQAVIEGKAISFNGMPDAPKQSQSLKRKKKKEHLRWMTGGLMAGVALAFLGLHVRTIIAKDQNPMRTIANEESRKKKEDLERRKFNPPQVAETKDNYVDSVIYTSGYVAKYQDADFQQKLYKAASTYLLKTWRVDEDKSIQVLSIASALVKELGEKKENIHPDFVKDGITKMRALEKDSLDRMKVILGSEVRLESFRRFENKFFEEEMRK